MSVPHVAAFFKALATSRQAVASWYVYFFQLPWLPERLLLGRTHAGAGLSKLLRYWGKSETAADRDALAMTVPGILTAALNWYRAVPLTDPRVSLRKTVVPTMYMWSQEDAGLLEKGARECGRHVSGEYRFEVLKGSHWIVDEQPDVVSDLLLDWFARHR
jgi:pimeloyl-ACP methyl ester carboxylesterase